MLSTASLLCPCTIVLSALYQEKLVTEQELEDLKAATSTWDVWDQLVPIQSTKPPDVVTGTVELLVRENLKREANILKGQ